MILYMQGVSESVTRILANKVYGRQHQVTTIYLSGVITVFKKEIKSELLATELELLMETIGIWRGHMLELA